LLGYGTFGRLRVSTFDKIIIIIAIAYKPQSYGITPQHQYKPELQRMRYGHGFKIKIKPNFLKSTKKGTHSVPFLAKS
jgi:hypothetical protein